MEANRKAILKGPMFKHHLRTQCRASMCFMTFALAIRWFAGSVKMGPPLQDQFVRRSFA